jgi:hypothetical protein
MLYRLFGSRIRRKACELAAQAAYGMDGDQASKTLWELATFFERYMLYGSDDSKPPSEVETGAHKPVVQLIARDD